MTNFDATFSRMERTLDEVKALLNARLETEEDLRRLARMEVEILVALKIIADAREQTRALDLSDPEQAIRGALIVTECLDQIEESLQKTWWQIASPGTGK